MKVVFCLNDFGSRTYNLFLTKAAILSAKFNTSFDIVCIFDGNNPYFEHFLKQYSIKIIKPEMSISNIVRMTLSSQHSSSDFWEKDYNKIINFATGAFLRFEVANVLDDGDEYCLYVDVDTLFTDKFKVPEIKPKFMAMSRQDFSHDGDFNSGVILFNLKNFKNLYKELLQKVCGDHKWVDNMYDQYIVNEHFKEKIEDLDMTYNWRPGFGIHYNAQIIHYERAKPLQGHAGVYQSIKGTDSYMYYEDYFFQKLKEFNI